MGAILGFIVGVGLAISAWDGSLEPWGLGVFVVAGVLGVVLIPRTVGMFMTGVMGFSPIAILAGLISGHGSSALTALGIGIGAFATQLLVGKLRSESS